MTSLQRLLTAAPGRRPAGGARRRARLVVAGDGDRRRRRAVERAQRRQGGRDGGRNGPRRGSTTCGSSPSGRRSPPGNSEVRAPGRLQLRRSEQPRLQLVARGPRGGPGQRGRACARMLVVTGPGPVWASQVPRATTSATSRAPTSSASSRARRRCATPARWIAGSSGTSRTCRCGCSRRTRATAARCTPVRAAPLPPPGARGLPGDQDRRPDVDGALRRAGAQRREPDQAERQDAPLAFIRSMGCVKVTLKRDRSGPCKGFKPLTGDGVAYHPHATTLAPDEQQATLDNASIGDLPRLERTLDATQRAGGLKKRRRRAVRPVLHRVGLPDAPARRTRGVTLAQQSRYLQQGAYIAYRDPARQAPDAVRVARRAGPPRDRRRRLRGLAVGPALRQRQAEAGAEELRQPVRHRPAPGSRSARLWGQVRPGVTHQRDGAAAPGGLTTLDER